MKKYISKLFLLVACTSFFFASCSKDAEGVIYDTDELAVTFASEVQIAEVSETVQEKILIPVYRSKATGEATVSVSFADESGLFTLVSSEAKFADGQNVAYVEVSVKSVEKLEEGVEYETLLSITNKEQVSVSGISQLVLVVVR